MNAPFIQGTRAGRLATVLGADTLVLLRFAGSDRLSGLFSYEVDCLSTTPDIDFDALVGTHATVTLVTHRGEDRPFDGIVTEARWLGVGENGHRYRLTLRPWFWLATRRRNQRIFHDKTVTEILQELLAAYAGAGPLEIATTTDYPKLEYTVQYRESDFAFACRMMERFGLSYHFQHEPGSHRMVVTDAADIHPTIGPRKFRGYGSQHHAAEEHFHAWAPARRITTGAVRLTDYNFKAPKAAMEVDRTGDAAHAEGQIESFDWPGDYLDQGQGKSVVARSLARERGQDQRYEALGDAMSLAAGLKVTLDGDPVPGTGAEFLCLVAEHSYTSDAYGSGEAAAEADYNGRYVLMPSDAPLAPERKTPLAVVQGPQTAVVVGEGEIDCDDYGRILVRFHWDLAAAHSMRCRVSQNWGGAGWGGMVIPRIGMEVVVEFLEGDPDKPLVTGCVYNAKQTVPYPLPANKTVSTFKTQTHQAEGYNELRFEDEAGREEIFLHAQKDHNTKVENNQTARVNINKVESVGHSKASEIDNFHDHVVGGDMRVSVGPSHKGKFTPGDATENDQGIAAVAVGLGEPGGQVGSGDMVIEIDRDLSETVGRDVQQHVDGNKAVFIGGNGGLVLGALAGLVTAGSAFMRKHGSAAGAPVGSFASAMGGMVAAVPGMQGLFGKLLGGSGSLNTVIEKFRSDTIGIARTEQIGLYKNTVVGHTQSLSVGKKHVAVIGEDYDLEAKASIFTRTRKHTEMATEKIVIGGPGGTIIIDASGVTIKARAIRLKAPAIDMTSGSPNEAQLASDKPYNQDCSK
ncbi:type VI secretion system Vgr family protein [Tabrizicola aquatica]|uniref:type VI secretion system Vgr family protein n=1 Tax=Tabrizicola aquatica TaxID=909926 RepID=UPI000CCFEBAD|nr:type VI secretion system tip protein TssI/VgrG [Tabrizicola aquatica]